MVEVQLAPRVSTTAILTAMVVPGVDVESTEADRPPRESIVIAEQDHARGAHRTANQPDGRRVRRHRKGAPTREVEGPIVEIDRVRQVEEQEGEGAAD
jgi:hypothetical protein